MRWEYAWFKRSNGHRVTGPTATPLPLALHGPKRVNRYVLRRRPVQYGEWEDA